MRMLGLQAAVLAFVLLLVVGLLGCSTGSDTAPLSDDTSSSPSAPPVPQPSPNPTPQNPALPAAELSRGQEQAIAEIEKLGGSVKVDQQNPHKPVVSVHLAGPKVTDASLEHLKGLTNLRVLDLCRTQVTDAGLVHLKGLTNLQKLGRFQNQIARELKRRFNILTARA